MQKFVNNWSATLQAPLLAADSEMQLPPALAALLLLGEGDYYDLTLDPQGPAPEIVRVTGVEDDAATLGERGLEGTAPSDWPAGTVVECCITAGLLERLDAGGGGSSDSGWVETELGGLWIRRIGLIVYMRGYVATEDLEATPSGGVYLPAGFWPDEQTSVPRIWVGLAEGGAFYRHIEVSISAEDGFVMFSVDGMAPAPGLEILIGCDGISYIAAAQA